MKHSVMAYEEATWVKNIPLILLGLWAAESQNSGVSPTAITYRMEVRLPHELSGESKEPNNTMPEYVGDLATHLRRLDSTIRGHTNQCPIYTPETLEQAENVFLCTDTPRTRLQPPYTGSCRVIRRDQKTLTINIESRPGVVSKDKVKAVYIAKAMTATTVPEPEPITPRPK